MTRTAGSARSASGRRFASATLTLRVWQSLPHEKVDELESVGRTVGPRRRVLARRLPEGVHGWHARLADRSSPRRSGVQITSRAELVEIAPRRTCRLPRRGARDRRPREPRGARRVRSDARSPGARSGSGTGSSTRSCSRRGRLPLRAARVAASVQFMHAVSDRDLADRLAGASHRAYRWRALWDAGTLTANGSDAPIEELDPWAGVAAGVRKTWDDREPWHARGGRHSRRGAARNVRQSDLLSRDERHRGRLPLGLAADLSCSTATRTRSSPTHFPTCRSSPRWSTAGGLTIRPRGERSVKANETGDVIRSSFMVARMATNTQIAESTSSMPSPLQPPISRRSMVLRRAPFESTSARSSQRCPCRSAASTFDTSGGAAPSGTSRRRSPATKARTRYARYLDGEPPQMVGGAVLAG